MVYNRRGTIIPRDSHSPERARARAWWDQPPQQPPSDDSPQAQPGPQDPSCSLWAIGRGTAVSVGGGAGFFVFARISMRLIGVGGLPGGFRYI